MPAFGTVSWRPADLPARLDRSDLSDFVCSYYCNPDCVIKILNLHQRSLSASWVNRVSKSDSSLAPSTSYSSSRVARSSPSLWGSWIRFQTRAPMFEDTCCFETTTLVEFDKTLPSLQSSFTTCQMSNVCCAMFNV